MKKKLFMMTNFEALHFSGTFRQAQAQKLMGVVSVGVLATTYLHSLVLLHCLNAEKVLTVVAALNLKVYFIQN